MQLFSSKWWSIDLPQGWDVKTSRDYVHIIPESGISLRITTLHSDTEETTIDELKRYAKPFMDVPHKTNPLNIGMLNGFTVETKGDPAATIYIRAYLKTGKLLWIIAVEFSENVRGRVNVCLEELISRMNPK